MIFRQFLNEPIAALSYLVGCAASGEAAVVDPNLPPERYILAAANHGLRIRAVLEFLQTVLRPPGAAASDDK